MSTGGGSFGTLPDEWSFGPEDNYEVGDTFEWSANFGDVSYASNEKKPYGTYRITRKREDPFGRKWYEAELIPKDPMTEELMREIST